MTWHPDLYERFLAWRTRPFADLIAAVAPWVVRPRRIVDLGCGTGRNSRWLKARWPAAEVIGVDRSAEMLARAAAVPGPAVRWVEADLADLAAWQPDGPVDLLVSNAALHWVPDHDRLMPALAGAVAPGGVIAVQMPRNFEAPSARLVAEVARAARWRDRLDGVVGGPAPVGTPEDYHRRLAPELARLEIWETRYLQDLPPAGPGERHPVVSWLDGTTLVPVKARLGADHEGFLDALERPIAAAYPPQPGGTVLFAFLRLFVIGKR